MSTREHVQHLANAAIDNGQPLQWFETLYAQANKDTSQIPWANKQANPNLVSWVTQQTIGLNGMRVLVVGCGLGDDAEWLASQGARVSAFDISPSAITWANERSQYPVSYDVVDLFDAPQTWQKHFDLIVEIYTLQALPLELRKSAMPIIASWLAPRGKLLIITQGRDNDAATTTLPWPLSHNELEAFEATGLAPLLKEDYDDPDEPGQRRFRHTYENTH